MEAWAIILIVLVVLCSTSSILLSIFGPKLFINSIEQEMTDVLVRNVVGKNEADAKKTILENARRSNFETPTIIVGGGCPTEEKGKSGLYVVLDMKDGRATGINVCLNEYVYKEEVF